MTRVDRHCSWPMRGRRRLSPWRTGDRGKAGSRTLGEYASDEVLLGWLPGRTRHAVAIDLGEGLGTQND